MQLGKLDGYFLAKAVLAACVGYLLTYRAVEA